VKGNGDSDKLFLDVVGVLAGLYATSGEARTLLDRVRLPVERQPAWDGSKRRGLLAAGVEDAVGRSRGTRRVGSVSRCARGLPGQS